MALIRVLMMQRDEGPLLARWLRYYGNLFGADNLTIMDNGSTDPETLSYLQSAELAGTTVMRDFVSAHDFQHKGGHFVNIIRHIWDPNGGYDFALPVDCDEFLAVFTEQGISTKREDILGEFEGLKDAVMSLRIPLSMFNVPDRPGWYAPITNFHKGFVRAGTLKIMDSGQHEPITATPGYQSTRFTYLHEHNRPYAEFRRRLMLKLRGMVDTEDAEALTSYLENPPAHGAHIAEALRMSEADYLSRYSDMPLVWVPTFSGRSKIEVDGLLGWWSNEKYLLNNPDVGGYHLGLLQHYLTFGWREGRRIEFA